MKYEKANNLGNVDNNPDWPNSKADVTFLKHMSESVEICTSHL